MKSTHRLFHVIVTTSAFALGCGGGSSASQEPAGTPASMTAANADGEPSGDASKTVAVEQTGETAGNKAADRPKANNGSADKDKGPAKAAKPPARMGVAGW